MFGAGVLFVILSQFFCCYPSAPWREHRGELRRFEAGLGIGGGARAGPRIAEGAGIGAEAATASSAERRALTRTDELTLEERAGGRHSTVGIQRASRHRRDHQQRRTDEAERTENEAHGVISSVNEALESEGGPVMNSVNSPDEVPIGYLSSQDDVPQTRREPGLAYRQGSQSVSRPRSSGSGHAPQAWLL